jgi:sterol desaturase/sphingolipid hydroxylase (fatty acid hydroxylase superfamily)
MTLSATVNHAGVEIYPSGKFGKWFKKWVIGATHHDAHHKKFNFNYGLYFTFWDRLMKTELEE